MMEIERGLKIGSLDIETTGLKGNYHRILCACIKPFLANTIFTVRTDNNKNPDLFSDRWVVQELIKEMNKYEVLVTHYGTRFDRTFLNTRALKHRICPPNKFIHRDLWFTWGAKLCLTSNRLETIQKTFNLSEEKSRLDFDVWELAMRGNKQALDKVVFHCRQDVKVTEEFYKLVLPLLGEKLRKT